MSGFEVEGTKDTPTEGSENTYEVEARNFRSSLEAWDGKQDKTFKVGTTSAPLQSLGVPGREITFRSGKINKILQDHPGMKKEIIAQAPRILNDPILVAKSKTHDSRIVVFGDVVDMNGAPVLAALELQPTGAGGELIDVVQLTSLYGKDKNPGEFIRTSEILYLDPNKNRTEAWLQGLGVQFPSDITTLGSIGSITYENGKVKVEGIPIFRQATENTDQSHPDDTPSDLEVLRKLAEEMARESIRRGDLGPVPEIPPRPVQQSPQEILSRLAREMTQDPTTPLASLSDEDIRAMLDEIARKQGDPLSSSHDGPPVSFLETTLEIDFEHIKGVIPKGAKIERLRTIGGETSKAPVKAAQYLSKLYGGQPLQWLKMGGIIQTDNFRYDVHWFELDGKHYEEKCKEAKKKEANK